MKKGEVYTAKIGVTSFPDTGYVKIEDNTVELKKVIEGQEAEFVIVKKRKNRASARVLKKISFTNKRRLYFGRNLRRLSIPKCRI